ncbi:MAG: mitochondrial distribution and morphology family 33, partial [Piptocephalis tieghemiana]
RMGQRVNEYTGYNVIEALKEAVLQAERDFYKAREDLETSKAKYEETIKTRAEGQRELNGLLQRKSSWSDQDLTRFTALYREEHAYEAAETEARTAHRAAEATVEQSYTHLVDAIRARYHEEQVWSDRIRAASTYGTWALMGIHVLLFLIVQTVVEPRKRRKLAERLEASLNEQRHTEEAILNQKLQALESSLLNHHAQMDRIEQNIHHLS